MIPTYNEGENIQELVQDILNLPLDAELSILVVDDNSPDGTGEKVKQLANKDGRVHVLTRKKRRGRGAAGIDGFKHALSQNPDFIIEMDGDFSHQPAFIPSLLTACGAYDIAIGSRFVKGGKDFNRNFARRLITFLVRIFIRRLYGVTVRDVSSGFRCFRKEVLEKIDPDDLISAGPSLVLEILYKASRLNLKIGEVPITFTDREKGRTKLTLLTLAETLIMAMKFKKMYASFGLKEERTKIH